MRNISPLMVGLAVLVGVSGAEAQATRTWVSGVGDDANPCSRTAPCQTFAGAISKTAAGGEIDALDPGGFGAVTITKAITLDGGSYASILAVSTHGIIVNAGTSDRVVIRNLSFNGVNGGGLAGIRFIKGNQLVVDHCAFQGWGASSYAAIDFEPTEAGSGLAVNDTVIHANNANGVTVNPAGAVGATAVFDRVQLLRNGYSGIAISGGTTATVRNSTASQNGAAGFYTDSGGAASQMMIADSVASNNNIGVKAQLGGTVFISRVAVSGNATGLKTVTGGTIYSYGDNRVDGNAIDGTPSAGVTTR